MTFFRRFVYRAAPGRLRLHSDDGATVLSDFDKNLPNLLLLEGFNPLTVFSWEISHSQLGSLNSYICCLQNKVFSHKTRWEQNLKTFSAAICWQSCKLSHERARFVQNCRVREPGNADELHTDPEWFGNGSPLTS